MYNCIWCQATILIGSDKSCDIGIIYDIIVFSQQGQTRYALLKAQSRLATFKLGKIRF